MRRFFGISWLVCGFLGCNDTALEERLKQSEQAAKNLQDELTKTKDELTKTKMLLSETQPSKKEEAKTIPAPPVAPQIPTTVSQWVYREETDAMGRQNAKYASVTSSNTLNFDFPYQGEQHGMLMLRDNNKGKDVMLMVQKGQFNCSSYDGCSVTVRFDEEKAQRFSASGASSGNSEVIFLNGYEKFVKSVRKSKKVLIEAEFYQEGTEILEFDISGYSW